MNAQELKLGEMIWDKDNGELLRLKETVAYNTTGEVELDVVFSIGTEKTSKTVPLEQLGEKYEKLDHMLQSLSPAQRAAFGLLLVDVNSIKMAMVQAFNGQSQGVAKNQTASGIIY
jgi:hypothetical protein